MAATETLAARAEAMLNRLAQAQAEAASQQARTEIEAARARASRIAADLCAARDAAPVLAECGVAVDLAVPGALLQEAARARTALRTAATSMVGAQPDEVASRVGSQSVDAALATAEQLARSMLAGLNRSVERRRQELLPAGIGERIVAYPGTSDALVVRLGNIQRRLQQKVENLHRRATGAAGTADQRRCRRLGAGAASAGHRPGRPSPGRPGVPAPGRNRRGGPLAASSPRPWRNGSMTPRTPRTYGWCCDHDRCAERGGPRRS